MEKVTGIPESILKDLDLYLETGETITKGISSASGMVGRLGELWVILSNRNVFFHTKEFGKECVVALIPRNDIKTIMYYQYPAGVTLTFIPQKNPKNTTKISFPKVQKKQLEDFCEEFADLITFQPTEPPEEKRILQPNPASGKKEHVRPIMEEIRLAKGASVHGPEAKPGKKSEAQPAYSVSNLERPGRSQPPAELRIAKTANFTTSATPNSATAPTTTTAFLQESVKPTSDNPDKPRHPSTSRVPPLGSPPKGASTPSVDDTPENPRRPGAFRVSTPSVDENSPSVGEIRLAVPAPTQPLYVIIATAVSMLVAFLWYKFFLSIADSS